MKNETKRMIRQGGVILFGIYVILLIYFLFFSESYGRVADAERIYRYNLIPFVEIRRFWVYRRQLGTFALFTNIFGNVIGFIPYGFIMGLLSFSEAGKGHKTSIIGSITNGIIMILWLGIYLTGV